jgi:hypothetical protein
MMLKSTVALAGLVAIAGCGDIRDREAPRRDAADATVEMARTEAPRNRGNHRAPVPVAEAEVAQVAPDQVARAEVPPTPGAEAEPAPMPDPAPIPDPSGESGAGGDTSAYVPYPPPEPAPDSADASPAGTAASSRDTPTPTAPGPAPTPAVDTTGDSTAAMDPNTDAAPALAAGTLAAGTVIHAVLQDSIHSRNDVSGKVVSGLVMENVTGADGKTIIPAGSPVRFTVTQVKPGRGDRPGVIEMRVDTITIGGRPMSLESRIQAIPYELRGRGVTGEEAAKVGVGAAGGAVVGRVLGGNTEGAVIGGVVGAAGGAVVASETAAKDVVVKAKTPVEVVLTAPMVTGR